MLRNFCFFCFFVFFVFFLFFFVFFFVAIKRCIIHTFCIGQVSSMSMFSALIMLVSSMFKDQCSLDPRPSFRFYNG